MRENIEVGYQTFVSDGGEEFGAVRQVAPHGRPELVIYVENAGDFVVPLDAVEAVHSQKVILNCRKLDRRLREAIGHAHDAEVPGAAATRGAKPASARFLAKTPPSWDNTGGTAGVPKKAARLRFLGFLQPSFLLARNGLAAGGDPSSLTTPCRGLY